MSKQTFTAGMWGYQLVDALNNNDGELYAKGSSIGINVKDYGAFGNGVTDDTAFFQIAIDLVPVGGTLFIPQGIYMIKATGDDAYGDDGGIRITKPMTIIFEKNAELKAIPGSKIRSQIIKVLNTSYVEIYNGKLTGDWKLRADNNEGNHCIACENSSNIYIHDMFFSRSAGDGIVCERNGGDSQNITIERCEFTDYKRWGIFLDISQNGLINNCKFFDVVSDIDIAGGIDIEYHGGQSGVHMKNITVSNCSFDRIGNTTSFAKDGAITVNGSGGVVDEFRFINNRITDCIVGVIMDRLINYNIQNNTFTNTGGVGMRGNIDSLIYGKIQGNVFSLNGGVFFGYGNVNGATTELLKGIIIDGNRFNDITGACIGAQYVTLSQSLIINNVFNSSPNHYSLPIEYCNNLHYSNNLDTATGLIV